MADPNALAFGVPTIASSGAPQVVNPLAAITAGNAAAAGMYDLRAKQAQEAAGQAFLNSIDPKTGQPNQALLMQNLAGNPRSAMAAQASAQAGQTLDTNTYKLHTDQLGRVNGLLAQLVADNPNGVPGAAAHGAILTALQTGLIPMQTAQKFAGIFGDDTAGNTKTILQLMGQNLSTQQQLQAAKPGVGSVDTGQGLQGYTTPPLLASSPNAGTITPVGGELPTGKPGFKEMLAQVDQPADAATAAALGVPEGTRITVPMLQRWMQQGGGNLVRGRLPGTDGVGGAAPSLPSNTNVPQGTTPGRTRPDNAALTPKPAAGDTTQPFKPVVTGLPAGTDADTAAWQAGNAAMDPMKARETAGVAALQALELAHTGYGTPGVNRVKAFMIAQGIPGAGLIDQGGVEAYQLARKQLLRFAQDSSKTSGTNLGLETQLESNANVDTMLNATNEHILKQDLGTLRQRMAMQLTAPNRGIGATEFGSGHGEHTKNFLPQTDPVAFAWDKISPEERAAHLAQIENSPTAKARWMRSMRIARDKGIISVPGQ